MLSCRIVTNNQKRLILPSRSQKYLCSPQSRICIHSPFFFVLSDFFPDPALFVSIFYHSILANIKQFVHFSALFCPNWFSFLYLLVFVHSSFRLKKQIGYVVHLLKSSFSFCQAAVYKTIQQLPLQFAKRINVTKQKLPTVYQYSI